MPQLPCLPRAGSLCLSCRSWPADDRLPTAPSASPTSIFHRSARTEAFWAAAWSSHPESLTNAGRGPPILCCRCCCSSGGWQSICQSCSWTQHDTPVISGSADPVQEIALGKGLERGGGGGPPVPPPAGPNHPNLPPPPPPPHPPPPPPPPPTPTLSPPSHTCLSDS